MKKLRLRTIISILAIWMLAAAGLSGCKMADNTGEGTKSTPDAKSRSAGTYMNEPSENLTVHFLDIGQGDCAVLTQDGHAMLIDAGDNDKGTAVQAYLNYLGIEFLDYVILTHPDADHIGGADVVIYKFDCGTILMPDHETDTRTYDDVIQAMKSKGYRAEHPQVGDTYSFGNASFTVLSPSCSYPDNNNNSIVIRLTHGENTFLFTGDAEEEAEADMLAGGADVQADVLKAGHHGSSTSTSDEFLEAVSPSCAVISCAEGNKYGHPHAETMNKFRQAGITVYRTDEQGTITVSSDGTALTWNTSPSDSWLTGEASGTGQNARSAAITYILNTNTMKFHLPDCPSVQDIAPSNREESTLSRKKLQNAGYEPCGRCNP